MAARRCQSCRWAGCARFTVARGLSSKDTKWPSGTFQCDGNECPDPRAPAAAAAAAACDALSGTRCRVCTYQPRHLVQPGRSPLCQTISPHSRLSVAVFAVTTTEGDQLALHVRCCRSRARFHGQTVPVATVSAQAHANFISRGNQQVSTSLMTVESGEAMKKHPSSAK